MATFDIWMLGESNLSISGSEELSGYIQGDGSHLVGETITFTSKEWTQTTIKDNDLGFGEDEDIQRLHGETTIDGVTYAHNSIVEAEYIITVSDPQGVTYTFVGYNINEPNSPYDTYGTVEGLAFVDTGNGMPPTGVPLTVTSSTDGPSDGINIPVSNMITPPCFTPGTSIETPSGNRLVEDLEIGDLVLTRDAGPQPILWIGSVHLDSEQLWEKPVFRPILLRKDALGRGRPNRDMHLSPQHHVLIRNDQVELLFGQHEVLVAAKDLVNEYFVMVDHIIPSVTYLHLYFEQHQLVVADGLEVESFRPGVMGFSGLPDDTQKEFIDLFPEHDLTGPTQMTAARTVLKSWESRVLNSA